MIYSDVFRDTTRGGIVKQKLIIALVLVLAVVLGALVVLMSPTYSQDGTQAKERATPDLYIEGMPFPTEIVPIP